MLFRRDVNLKPIKLPEPNGCRNKTSSTQENTENISHTNISQRPAAIAESVKVRCPDRTVE